jgi:multimeric flavodoxin WrbA
MAGKYVLALSSSPRRKGNSRVVLEALMEGVAEAGNRGELVQLSDVVTGMLRNCRECRRPDGSCSIEDGYRELFFDKFLPCDALVVATPIYWYGMSAHLKNFFDRWFCYWAASYPGSDEVQKHIYRKRLALVLSAEENNLPARMGILHSISEVCRYVHWSMVGVVTGIGNSTGEAVKDPLHPLEEARALGRRIFEVKETDYKGDTPRDTRVWQEGKMFYPTSWR